MTTPCTDVVLPPESDNARVDGVLQQDVPGHRARCLKRGVDTPLLAKPRNLNPRAGPYF
jgi:hypothetical protein